MSIIAKDLFTSSAGVIIVPHSTQGLLSPQFEEKMIEWGLRGLVPVNVTLGNVQFVVLPKSSPTRYIGFVCTTQQLLSSYGILRQIAQDIIDKWPDPKIKHLALSIIGVSGQGMVGEDCYRVLSSTFAEASPPDLQVDFHVINEELWQQMVAQEINLEETSAHLVFRLTLPRLIDSAWVQELITADGFYFDKAKTKYEEFISYEAPTRFFTQLADGFDNSEKVYSDFIEGYDKTTRSYKFLLICGELVAYIDKHAFNKQVWNQYEDKRTMARSAVNQTRWISGLLRFKASENNLTAVSASIRNALRYLETPDRELTMLSLNHRKLLYGSFFSFRYDDEFLGMLFEEFAKAGFLCNDPTNNGYLISRVLYAPEIKMLWQGKVVEKEPTLRSEPDKPEVLDAEDILQLNIIRKKQIALHSDKYAAVDLLNYSSFAAVLARMIRSGLTKPPLNIGIMAPWGQGKTTLMRFIAKELGGTETEQKLNIGDPEARPTVRETAKTTGWGLFKLLWRKPENVFKRDKLPNPVVWFNAWKFQKSEQIWAGLAHEIIKQLADRLTDIEREQFWLRLNLKRVCKG